MFKLNKTLQSVIAGVSLFAAISAPALAGEPGKTLLTPTNHKWLLQHVLIPLKKCVITSLV